MDPQIDLLSSKDIETLHAVQDCYSIIIEQEKRLFELGAGVKILIETIENDVM